MTSLWRHTFPKNAPNDFIFGQKLDITKIFTSCKLYENLTNSDIIMTSLRFHRNMTSLWRNYDTILTWRSILYSLLKWTFPKLKNEGLTIPTQRFPEKLWAFFDMLVFDVIDVIVTSFWRHSAFCRESSEIYWVNSQVSYVDKGHFRDTYWHILLYEIYIIWNFT